jgi:hypothetical protein
MDYARRKPDLFFLGGDRAVKVVVLLLLFALKNLFISEGEG